MCSHFQTLISEKWPNDLYGDRTLLSEQILKCAPIFKPTFQKQMPNDLYGDRALLSENGSNMLPRFQEGG